MSQAKVILVVLLMIGGFAVAIHLFTATIAPPEGESVQEGFNMSRPRAPTEARKMLNPFPRSEEIVKKGEVLYHTKGSCNVCHGEKGKGDGGGGAMLSPPPRDFTDPGFQMLRTDGELFWSTKFGISGTGMFSYSPRMITEEETWMVIHYIRSLNAQATATPEGDA